MFAFPHGDQPRAKAAPPTTICRTASPFTPRSSLRTCRFAARFASNPPLRPDVGAHRRGAALCYRAIAGGAGGG